MRRCLIAILSPTRPATLERAEILTARDCEEAARRLTLKAAPDHLTATTTKLEGSRLCEEERVGRYLELIRNDLAEATAEPADLRGCWEYLGVLPDGGRKRWLVLAFKTRR